MRERTGRVEGTAVRRAVLKPGNITTKLIKIMMHAHMWNPKSAALL